MKYIIKELRTKTGLTQKEFAQQYHIPLSTLCKWECGESSPAPYVIELIARTLPGTDPSLQCIHGKNHILYYYNALQHMVLDAYGNAIYIKEDLDGVKEQNLALYLSDLFEGFYQLQKRFNNDVKYDKEEDILWT